MDQPSLFHKPSTSPLPHRARPQHFGHFKGQKSTVEALQKLPPDNTFHFIFWGPPGSGKTTIVNLLAKRWQRELYTLNAVTSGVADLKKLIQSLQDVKNFHHKQAIIFIDEIHRFNKAQQDVLLPHLERGDFSLMGATTEHPQTSLNKAILSRVRTYELKKLQEYDIIEILTQFLQSDKTSNLKLEKDSIKLIAHYSNGDARIALSHLEYLQQFPNLLSDQKKLLNYLNSSAKDYDKNSHRHYDVISAFIKSVRGSDPDAALQWLAVMLEGGEDPAFIARRLLILASEDIGNAQPFALSLASSTHYTVSQIGMPEARIPLAQCTVYLACSPKSNSCYLAIDQAINYVREHPSLEVPGHLKNHSPEKKNYRYPHSYPHHYIKQDYRYNRESFLEFSEQGREIDLKNYLDALE